MAAETPDRIDIGRLQNLLGRDSSSLPVTQVVSSPPRSAENLVPRTPAKHFSHSHSHDPHTPATYFHAHSHSHDRTGSLQLAYSPSYSQVDLGETQVDDGAALYLTQPDDVETQLISPASPPEIVHNTPEPEAPPTDTLVLDPTPEDDPPTEPESAPVYFSEARRFSSPHTSSSPVKKPAGHNPLSAMSFPAARRMPISLTQMFDAVSSPLRSGPATGGTSLPPTPSAAEATKLLARTLSRMESDLITVPEMSSPVSVARVATEEEDSGAGSPTQVDPVTVYVSMQQSQEARERNMRKRFGARRGSVERSVSPVVFNSSFVQRLQKQRAESDDEMVSSGEERRRRANAARRKGDEEVKRLFTAVKASRRRGGLEESQGRGKERARSEETAKKKSSKKPIAKLRRRQTKSASPPSPTSTEETGDEEVVVERTPDISRTSTETAPTASNESIPPTAEEEDDVALPMNKTTTAGPSQPRPPIIFTSDAPLPQTQVLNSNNPSSTQTQTQYTQLPPEDWESLHQPPLAATRRRLNPASQPRPVSAIADSQPTPAPALTRGKTSLRNLPPFNIPSPAPKRPVPEFVQETSGLVPPRSSGSSLTTVPSEMESPMPVGAGVKTPFVPRGVTTVPGTVVESPTRKRKRYEVREEGGEVVPCSVEEEGVVEVDGGGGLGRPELDDVDMVGDVGAGEEVTPRVGKKGGRRESAKRAKVTPKAAQADTTMAGEEETQEAVPEQAKSAPAKTKGKTMPAPRTSRASFGKPATKLKSKALVRKTRASVSLRNSLGSLAPDTPTPLAGAMDTDDDADTLVSNNPAFSMSVSAPPGGAVDVSVTVPERVFALFRDGKGSFHPATVLESDVYTGTVKVVFDDGTEDMVERSNVRGLDLRVGDGVKVDLTGMKKAVWEVVGLKPGDGGEKVSDCRGHTVVSVKARKAASAAEGGAEVVDVGVTNIYLVKSMWKEFHARVYRDLPGRIGNATPSESFSVHSAPTTPSKLRTTPMTASFSGFVRPGAGLFAGMVFALSFGDKESVKRAVAYKIIQNGGKIVDSGFQELFYDIDRPTNPASDSFSSDSSRETIASPIQFTPRPESERAGFTAVIADTHSRRAKFLQALALGLPCLAAKWVEDCCRRGRVMEWEHYLLPAGESRYLGTVRSRMLEGYDARVARFAGVVGGRRRLLEGRGVVVVVGMGKGVKVCEKRKPYLFLTYALGASRVAKAVTLEGVGRILQKAEGEEVVEKWDFVYVEAKDRGRAEKMFGGKGKRAKVKVVDDEWVVQSLILGRLIDDD